MIRVFESRNTGSATPDHESGLCTGGDASTGRAGGVVSPPVVRDCRLMRTQQATVIHELAAAHAGVITHGQAMELGFSNSAIHRRIQSGVWRPIHKAVYTTWPGPLSTLARVWAGLLYAGPDAVASHQTAAWLDGFGNAPARVDISVPQPRNLQGLPGVRFYRTTWLAQRRHPAKIPPRTRVEETVLDLIEQARTVDELTALVARACRALLTSPERIAIAADRRRKLKWRTELAFVLADVSDGAQALLERRYLIRIERAHGLPRGSRQHLIRRAGRSEYKDVYYDEPYCVVVELDGPVGHSGDLDRLRDMARDNADVLDGRLVLRFGFRDVERYPCEVAAQVARALRQRGWRGRPRPCGRHCRIHDQGLAVPKYGIAHP
ncbi:MAG TPA: type IV toxin-antitoxin system AbiEi family antitoxin domain-containing protein [Actinomycetes bacterium]|nr:type IV toxin-antitoxin system AbiEi family antitoxin domain-containing protein [Actinomycetes bacterium]